MQSISYFAAIEAAGGVPLGIAPADEHATLVLYERCDALLLPGGMDAAPELYGDTRHTVTEIQPELDALELTLTRWARRDRRPLLGVCRGAQVLNIAHGGTLWQDVPGKLGLGGHGAGESGTEQHDIVVAPQSRLGRVLDTTCCAVNSRHHQAVNRVGAGLTAVAHAPDGLVEAVEAEGGWFALGVQWHPEELPVDAPAGGGLFRALIEAASSRPVQH